MPDSVRVLMLREPGGAPLVLLSEPLPFNRVVVVAQRRPYAGEHRTHVRVMVEHDQDLADRTFQMWCAERTSGDHPTAVDSVVLHVAVTAEDFDPWAWAEQLFDEAMVKEASLPWERITTW